MIPAITPLTVQESAYMQFCLPAWATDAEIPAAIEWHPHPKMKGVAHGKPWFVDKVKGSIVVPIRMEPGSVYGEHLHFGIYPDGDKTEGEDVIFLGEGAKALVDARGYYTSTIGYHQDRWSTHTPRAEGEEPVIFIGVAHGGVLMTGMQGTWGATLLREFSIRNEALDRYFNGVPADSREVPTRWPLLIALLKTLSQATEDDPSGSQGDVDAVNAFLQKMWALSAADRVASAVRATSLPIR